ncbi:MAG TPA: septal ring lytic transglycosylase RlpA family protein [Solirubrobacteraceae bacterium]|jgi:rare lipoprotein A (peptidoglycan hydrolase)
MPKAKIAEKTLLTAAMLGIGVVGAAAPAAFAKQRGSAASVVGAASAPVQSEASGGSGEPTSSTSEPSTKATREEAAEYNGVSLATIFGPGLFGRHTACGQLLSKQVVGVANRTLPCGTLISVSYHGRRVTIPVIDRGPYGPLHANWDLTLGAARLLHITETTEIKAKVAGHVKNTPALGSPGEEGLLTGAPAAPQPLSGTTGGVSSS